MRSPKIVTHGTKIEAVRGRQMRDRHSPRLAGCGVATRQRHVREVSRAMTSGAIDDQELSAPDRPVQAEAGAVTGDANHGLGAAVLGQAREHVGVMVLDGNAPCRGIVDCESRRQVVGMQIVRDDVRLDAE